MLRRFILVFALALTLCLPIAFTATSSAYNPFAAACSDGTAKNSVGCKTSNQNGADPISGSQGVLRKVEIIIAFISGAAAIFIILFSGFKFVNANGDPQKVANARTTLLYTLIGLAVVAAANGITVFVINGIK